MAILKEVLSPILVKMGIEEGKVSALFNAEGTELTPEASNTLLQHDATRIAKVKTDSKTEGFTQGHNKGLSEGAEKMETLVKEKYGVTSDKKGIDLVDEIVTAKAAPPTLEEDKVKTHPAYIAMKDDLTKKAKDVETQWKTKYEDRDKDLAKQNTFAKVKAKADAVLEELNPILPEDKNKAATQKELLYAKLLEMEYASNENNAEDFIITKEGKVVEDAHGTRRDLKSIVTDIAGGIWDFAEGKKKSSAAATNDTDPVKAKAAKLASVKAPKDEKEYMSLITNETDPDIRIAIQDAWDKSQTTGA